MRSVVGLHEIFGVLIFVLMVGVSGHARAEQQSRIPPVATYQAMLKANKSTGWVQFRNYGGQQWLYFTPLQTLHCRLKMIRYSINSNKLDRVFDLVACNPQLPFSLPDKTGVDDIAVRLKAGTAKTVAVQVIWQDGTASDVMVYEPCRDVGERTCAWPLN